MAITEIGLQQVKDALESALEAEKRARDQLDAASERVDLCREAVECDHKKLESMGYFMYEETRCKKCGFTWMD